MSDGAIAFWSALAGSIGGSLGTLFASIAVVRYEMRRRQRLKLYVDAIPDLIRRAGRIDVRTEADKSIRDLVTELVALRWEADAASAKDRQQLDHVVEVGEASFYAWRKSPSGSADQKEAVQRFVDALESYHSWLGVRITPWWRRVTGAVKRLPKHLRRP